MPEIGMVATGPNSPLTVPVISTAPMRNPGACGLNVTGMEQEAFARIVPEQPGPIPKSRPGVPCVTPSTVAFVTVAVAVKVTCCVLLPGDWPTPPDGQTLTLPKFRCTKLAVTFSAEFMVTMHVELVPELAQAPPQPRNVEVPVGFAVSVTVNPLRKLSEHVPLLFPPDPPQLIAPGLDVIVPEPEPISVTFRAYVSAKFATTVEFAVSENEQMPVPLQVPPLQPVNCEP